MIGGAITNGAAAEIAEKNGIPLIMYSTIYRRKDTGIAFPDMRKGTSNVMVVYKSLLSKAHKKERLIFSNHTRETDQRWDRVISSVESRFMLLSKDGNTRCDRGSIMVWGYVWAGRVGPLITIKNKLDKYAYMDLIKRKVLPFMEYLSENNDEEFIYQEYNAPCHKSKLAEESQPHRELMGISYQESEGQNPLSKNLNGLERSINIVWKDIPVEVCETHCMTIPNRIHEMNKAHGGSTHY
ncbi:hypothetical protein PHYBLDRAFT_68686 [Phycomyces blakesleeanus NRRL 1555(-)]|uniref:Tc1-like transposase DDE domain-containing protein n=1 Tax=Phycomyces blakesleeanus (strain ATCC 8743b / DSM 1359 / FGSC 10004 / NBRC 33097 / NRRL 1555) TaxID=763407 RepID=A0A162PQR0_PHYB8|nr:hypothetical protein PHYBLDRAFT_68686 [Phycomyces blakesleeanus NRRL 1555(-)]OAD72046.1 hypothetical protein PHYBLDRAFT_68686 [Phycomyces blakesleeanus NRRL 1555(-)]|eukprot:XP_018290086.1 hypothetical protein PHYBLDRAFT_68686 [Phycomyces blakesleeanus NRRL 1555(-)]